MNTARVVDLAISVAAGEPATYLVNSPEPRPALPGPAVQVDIVEVPAAQSDLQIGQTVAADDLQSQTRPASGATSDYTVGDIRGLAMAGANAVPARTERRQSNGVNVIRFDVQSSITMQL